MCYNNGMSKAITARSTGSPDYIFIPRCRLHMVTSDKDSHFTESLAKNASESENLTGLVSNKILVRNVAISSTQALHFRLEFYARDVFTDLDLDVDSFVGAVDLDVDTYGRLA